MSQSASPESAFREIRAILAGQGIVPPDDWDARLVRFRELVVAANERHNLTRITQGEDFLFKHVLDSLLAARAFPELRTARRLADVGCGAGIPGIPLALTFGAIELTAIDSAGKKIRCVAEFLADLGLAGEALHGRAGELAKRAELARRFDIVTARAVADSATLIRECHRLLAPHGALIAYKTPRGIDEELDAAKAEAAKLGLRITLSETISLPHGLGERRFLRAAR